VDVELGKVGEGSVAATVFGLVERGAGLRPDVAAAMRGSVRITFSEGYVPVRLTFGADGITVADDTGGEADLDLKAALPDFVLWISAPLARGVPKPTARAGRAALARLADGRVDFSGRIGLARRLVALMSVHPSSVRADG
jgi:hypothetical protein